MTKGPNNREYLDGVLGHLARNERAVIEPVLQKYRHVFHDDEVAEFKGTDLVEHKIVTARLHTASPMH